MQPVLEMHDRSAFEIYCYYAHRSEDGVTRHLMALADHWRNIADLDDAAAAQLIRADGIDILVDLAGYTAAFAAAAVSPALRAGPGHLARVSALDGARLDGLSHLRRAYRSTGRDGAIQFGAPRADAAQPVVLPAVARAGSPAPRPPSRAGPPSCSARSINSGRSATVASTCGARSSQRAPGARIAGRRRSARKDDGRVARPYRATRHSSGPHSLSPRLDIQQYFAAISDVDIALDTMPYNGATTTLDTLWMGVPLVALAGDRSVARSATSILNTLGLPELVAKTRRSTWTSTFGWRATSNGGRGCGPPCVRDSCSRR